MKALTEQKDKKGQNNARSLIDARGLGNPPVFKGEENQFMEWLRKTEGFAVAT